MDDFIFFNDEWRQNTEPKAIQGGETTGSKNPSSYDNSSQKG